MKVLADFGELRPAEAKLVEWLQAGNRKTCEISDSVPDDSSGAVTLRANFIRFLALGDCDACRLPETGFRVKGAYIERDEDNSDAIKGLDFEGATLPGDLSLVACHIPDPVILLSAKVKNLFLDGSVLKAQVIASRLQAEGGFFLRRANHPDAASYPRFNAFINSADTLIPVVSLEMQSYWIPDDRSDRGMQARGYLWFHIAMGWALTLLAVAGFSGLIKTDNTK